MRACVTAVHVTVCPRGLLAESVFRSLNSAQLPPVCHITEEGSHSKEERRNIAIPLLGSGGAIERRSSSGPVSGKLLNSASFVIPSSFLLRLGSATAEGHCGSHSCSIHCFL